MSALLDVGDDFGDYRIEGIIGHSGAGIVYNALQRHIQRRVALKVLTPRTLNGEESRHRFFRQTAMLSRLDSAHIIGIYDYGEVDGCPFIATQLVSGGNLDQLLTDQGPMSPPRALEIARQMTAALNDAHEAGVIHRNIKPSNVLLRSGREPFVFLSGFGVEDSEHTVLRGAGEVVATWAYLSPEQWNGAAATAQSDIYSLGCVLWAMLTGRAPYDGSIAQVAMSHLRAPISQLTDSDESARYVNDVLRRSMAKEPSSRYLDAHELSDDLERVARIVRSLGVRSDDEVMPSVAASESTLSHEPRRDATATRGGAQPQPTSAAPWSRGGGRSRRKAATPGEERNRLDPAYTVSLDEAVRNALGVSVRLGAMGIDAPPLKLGRNDLVKVVISRETLAKNVVTGLVAQSQVPQVEALKTSAIMYVNLSGPAFEVTRLNPPNGDQLVADTAVWEFNVVPKASGTQTMTVSASMRIPVPEHGERTVSVPSLEMQIKVAVDRLFASRSFVRRNWQWVGTSTVAAAAVVVSIIWR